MMMMSGRGFPMQIFGRIYRDCNSYNSTKRGRSLQVAFDSIRGASTIGDKKPSSSAPISITSDNTMRTREYLEMKSDNLLTAVPIGAITPAILRTIVGTIKSWATVSAAATATPDVGTCGGSMAERLLHRVCQEDETCGTSFTTAEIYMYTIQALSNAAAPHRAEQLLLQMEEHLQHQKMQRRRQQPTPNTFNSKENFYPSPFCYNTVIDAWVQSKESDAGLRAQAVMKRRNEVHPKRTLYDYNMDLTVLAKCGDGRKAEELLVEMIRNCTDTSSTGATSSITPNTHSFTSVINAYAKSNLPDADERAEAVLKRMLTLFDDGIISSRPNVKTFTAVIDAIARVCGSYSGSHSRQWIASRTNRAESIVRHMQELHDSGTYADGEESILPTTITYNAMIHMYSQCKDAKSAEQILQNLQHLYERYDGDTNLQPDIWSFNSVMHAYAQQKTEHAATKVERIYRQLQRYSRTHNRITNTISTTNTTPMRTHHTIQVHPTIVTANIVIDAWAQCRSRNGACKAEQLLQELEHDFLRGHSLMRADNHTYNSVINGWALSSCPEAPAKAVAIFDRMVKAFRNGNMEARPTTVTFNTVLKAFSKSCTVNEYATEQVENFFQRIKAIQLEDGKPLLEPDMVSYSTLLDTWSKSIDRRAAEKCERLLQTLEQRCLTPHATVELSISYYNIWINALSQSGAKNAGTKAENILRRVEELQASGYNIQPDLITFNSVLNAWAKSSELSSASNAEALLQKMERLHEQNKLDFRPDSISYTTVINALAKSGEKDAASRAEQILLKMLRNHRSGDIHSKPNTFSFTAVIHAFSKCSSGNGPKKAETILRLMEKSFLEGNLDAEPNTVTFSAVIDAWSRSSDQDAYDKAEKIFREMIALEKMGRSVYVNTVTYASLINALARSRKLGKAKMAHAMLEEMEMLYQKGNQKVKPNMYVINSVLSACAFTKGSKTERQDAMIVVLKILDRCMHTYGKPDNITYSLTFQAFSALAKTIDEKAEISSIVHALFRKCCEEGLVDKGVLKKFRKAATSEVYRDLIDSVPISDVWKDDMTYEYLPLKWKCNVGRCSF